MERSGGWPPASSSATVRWSSARASSNVSAAMSALESLPCPGSVVSVTRLLVLLVGHPPQPRCHDDDTEPDPGQDRAEGDRGDDEQVARHGSVAAVRISGCGE